MDIVQKNLAVLISRYPALASLSSDLYSAADLLINSLRHNGKIMTCGNGGSASDAEHIVGELVKSFAYHRPVAEVDQHALRQLFPGEAETIINNLEGGVPAISLMSQVALNSAFANDVCYEFAVAQQVYALGQNNDVLIGISTSGRSKNILNAARVAKIRKVKVIGLTGAAGGPLAELCDVAIRVPSDLTHEIQEYHLPVYHYLCLAIEETFFGRHGLKQSSSQPRVKLRDKRSFPKKLSLLVFDFDGVFTDNRVLTYQDGSEGVLCSRGDGMGINLLAKAGVNMLVLSKEVNPVVQARAKKLNLPCIQGCDDKVTALQKYMKENNFDQNGLVYVGNDINDVPAMGIAAFNVAPSDAHVSVFPHTDLVLGAAGGFGAVRELADLILTRFSASLN